MPYIEVGRVVKAQGIKGEVKIKLETDDASRYAAYDTFKVGEADLKVETLRSDGGSIVVKFAAVADRNAAELLIGKPVFIDGAKAAKLPDGRYYIFELIGSEVFCDGKSLGRLTAVLQHGAADVYVIDDDKIMFPAVTGVLKHVDTAAKVIEVEPTRFKEVAVYED